MASRNTPPGINRADKYNQIVTTYLQVGHDMTDEERAAVRQSIYDLLGIDVVAGVRSAAEAETYAEDAE